jgi:hypothetical protein
MLPQFTLNAYLYLRVSTHSAVTGAKKVIIPIIKLNTFMATHHIVNDFIFIHMSKRMWRSSGLSCEFILVYRRSRDEHWRLATLTGLFPHFVSQHRKMTG